MSMNPLFPLVAGIVVFMFLASIFGKKSALLIMATVAIFVAILNSAF